MLALQPWRRRLAEVLSAGGLPAEQALRAEMTLRPIVRFRQQPALALIAASDIVIPPHERMMVWTSFLGAPENVNVSSRGTSKTTAVCVLAAGAMAMLLAKKKMLTLSSTGFRGGQTILNDMEAWAVGGRWDSQGEVPFVERSIERGVASKALLHRAQNYWLMKFRSHSSIKTLPTNNPDKIRGERAQIVFNDEANTTDPALISEVVRPFLAVKGGFDTGGAEAQGNAIFFTSTIDHAWRPFQDTVRASREGLARDLEAQRAARRGDWALHQALERRGLLNYTHTCFDYQDLIVREVLTNRQGRKFRVVFPNGHELLGRPRLEFRDFPRGIPFTERGEDGRIRLEGYPVRALTTYPSDLNEIERPLYDGTVDESSWMAENRNVVDTAGGDTYPHGLMDKVSCVGLNAILAHGDCSKEWQAAWPEDRGYFAPIMYECDDPCVLGVDVASGSRDFAAFCIMRAGPLAQGPFNPTGTRSLGNTEWSNVVWQEQHKLLSYRDIAEKIRQFRNRYNLVFYHEPWKEDWEWCRAIGLDSGGGGLAVRDALLFLDRAESDVAEGDVRIYDPRDDETKIEAVKNDPTALPMLDIIKVSDTVNDRLVEFTLGQMKTGRLYLPKWLEESQRPDRDSKHRIGYLGARVLDHQLRRLQQKPTARARSFFMPGDDNDNKNKKDSWASFIYAAKQLRAHLLRHKVVGQRAMPKGAVVARANSARGRGRAPGSKI